MSTENVAFRQHAPTLRPLTQVSRGNPEQAAIVILRRVRTIIRNGLAPAYLFIDPDLRAWVLNDHQSQAQLWIRDRWHDYVGCYSRVDIPNKPSLTPDLEGIMEDVVDHVAGIIGN